MEQSDPQTPVEPSVTSVSADARVVTEPNVTAVASQGSSTKPDRLSPHPHDPSVLHVDSIRGDVINAIRGFCMGAADTVPGISGGTIALIMGHYSRLVTAISHFDGTFLRLLGQRRLGQAAAHIDFRFLVALGAGILFGIVTLSGLMHYLLDVHLPETLAVFLGLLLASLWVVVQYVDRWSPSRLAACGAGIVVAAAIASLPTGHGNMSLPFLFLAASVAICAMILPGVSGAYVLLVLGVYHPITGLIKNLAKFQVTADGLVQMVVFAAGCVFGMLSFSRLLRHLLQRAPGVTMAGLMGLMIGSVGRLWPLQVPTAETAAMEPKYRVMQYVSPSDWDGSLATLAILVVVSAAIVLTIEWIAARSAHSHSPKSAS